MTPSLALLCPGQGTQHSAMFDMACRDTRAAAALKQWSLDAHLGAPLDEVLADPSRLFANQMAQPLIVAATLAMWTALKDDLPEPALVAGYSIGELSAHAIAGALSGVSAVGVAALRASLMNDCLHTTPGQALAALSGVLLSAASGMLAEHGFHVAIQTSEDSAIVGGLLARLPNLQAALAGQGARINLLPVEVASHTPYLRPAVAPFALALRQCQWTAHTSPVLAGISANRIDDVEGAISTLSRQLAEPIRWMDCMDALAEAGATVALELGPGATLSRMLQARHPTIACRSVADFRTLAGVRQWLDRSLAD